MKKHNKIDLIIADEGMLLTQAEEVVPEERIFSSRIYDNNLENWTEWTREQVDKFIEERDRASEVSEDPNPGTEETL